MVLGAKDINTNHSCSRATSTDMALDLSLGLNNIMVPGGKYPTNLSPHFSLSLSLWLFLSLQDMNHYISLPFLPHPIFAHHNRAHQVLGRPMFYILGPGQRVHHWVVALCFPFNLIGIMQILIFYSGSQYAPSNKNYLSRYPD